MRRSHLVQWPFAERIQIVPESRLVIHTRLEIGSSIFARRLIDEIPIDSVRVSECRLIPEAIQYAVVDFALPVSEQLIASGPSRRVCAFGTSADGLEQLSI